MNKQLPKKPSNFPCPRFSNRIYGEINIFYKNATVVLGLGGYGGCVVNALKQKQCSEVTLAIANTDIQALNASNISLKFELGKKILRGLGGRANLEIAKIAIQSSKEDLINFIDKFDDIILVAGLAGATGMAATEIILDSFKSSTNKNFYICAGLPFVFEGPKKCNFAKESLTLLCKMHALVFVFDSGMLSLEKRSIHDGIGFNFPVVITSKFIELLSHKVLDNDIHDIIEKDKYLFDIVGYIYKFICKPYENFSNIFEISCQFIKKEPYETSLLDLSTNENSGKK